MALKLSKNVNLSQLNFAIPVMEGVSKFENSLRMQNRIKEIRQERGLTQEALAEAVGTSAVQIHRIESGATRLNTDWMARIASALNVRMADLLPAEEPIQVGQGLSTVLVRGAVQAGQWVEAIEWPKVQQFAVAIPIDERWKKHTRVGLLVRGDSMDLVYPEGTILIAVPFAELDHWPRHGTRVIVQRRNRLGEYEATVKEIRADGDGHPWLWPRSTNPAHQIPIAMPRPDNDHDMKAGEGDIEDVAVTMLVIGSYRPEITPGPLTAAD